MVAIDVLERESTGHSVTPRELHDSCSAIVGRDYPAALLPIDRPFPAPGFFPVASGSFHSAALDQPITRRPFLFVGQDWGCESDLRAIEKDLSADIKGGTGKRLHALLAQASIAVEDCFLSNALGGVRRGTRNTGRSPGWNHAPFVARCAEALRLQIDLIQPRAIICLGRFAPTLLAHIYPECAVWNAERTFAKIDERGAGLIALSPASETRVGKLALLVHPCYRHVNVAKRRFRDAAGNAAEIAILQSC